MSDNEEFTIKIKKGTHSVIIRDWNGVEKEFNSLIVSAGTPEGGKVFLFGWGHPKDAAIALGDGLALAQNDDWYGSFIDCHTSDMALRSLPLGKTTTIDKLEKRWTEEDEEEAKKVTSH